jgi:2'-5' RNA ligase
MTAIRTFIAIHLPVTLQDKIGQVVHQLDQPKTSAVRWVPVRNIHLTLKFLGDVSPANLNILKEVLFAEVARHRSFEISIGGLGSFPGPQRPRVIWVGVHAPPSMLRLQHAIENEAKKLGYPPEERPFSPHLTLGRVASNASPQEVQQIARRLESIKVGELGTIEVESVQLFRSDLQPGGSVYTQLYSANMAPAAAKVHSALD